MVSDEQTLPLQALIPSLISPKASLLPEVGPQVFATRAAAIYYLKHTPAFSREAHHSPGREAWKVASPGHKAI